MKNENYNDVVVSKPWGHEYLCFANETVAIWLFKYKKMQALQCIVIQTKTQV